MSEKAKRRLTEIKVHEISFVDKAANKRNFLVLKAEEGFYEKVFKAIVETETKELETFVKGVESLEGDSYDLEEIKKFFPMPFMNQGLMNPFQAPDFHSLALLQQLAQLVGQALQQRSPTQEEAEGSNIVGNNYVNPQDNFNNFSPEPDLIEKKVKEMTQEEIQKAISDAVALAKEENAKELEAANAKLEAMAKALEDQSAKEFAVKAESLSVLGVDAEFGAVLKALSVADSENYAKVEEVLVKAADALNNIDRTEETGADQAVDATVENTADEIINKKADELQKENASMPRYQAVSKAVEILVSEGKI